MILSSRPLRFLALTVFGWAGLRTFMLWPVAEFVPALVGTVAPAVLAEVRSEPPVHPRAFAITTNPPARPVAPPPGRPRRLADPPTIVPEAPAFALAQMPREPAAISPDPIQPGIDLPPTFRTSRWSGSAWAILRPDGRATPFASQLGGSQTGARIAYAIDGARRVAIYARASTAVDAREREAAVGVDWRPTRLPVHFVAERRIGIDGVRSGTAIGAVGGIGPTRIAGPVRVEGYAQGGVIFRDGREGYADGSLRLTASADRRIDLGVGAWGGAQRGAARLDVGPTLGITLAVARRPFRLSADWRQRVAGDARPGSGPALSLGADF